MSDEETSSEERDAEPPDVEDAEPDSAAIARQAGPPASASPSDDTTEDGAFAGGVEAPAEDDCDDPDAVFRAFSLQAEDQKARRIGGAVSGILVGGTTIGLGAILNETINADAEPWYIVGGVLAGVSAVGLIRPSKAEQLAQQFHAASPGHTAEEAASFERRWEAEAEHAKKARMIGAVLNMVLGAGSAGMGIAIVSGAGDMTDDDRGTWGSIAVASGAGLITSGAVSLVVKSPLESSFDEYMAANGRTRGTLGVTASVGAGPTGFALTMSGSF
jgi:F0F1-type ATP synthase assembly protein I